MDTNGHEEKRNPRRGSTKGHEGKRQKDIHEGPRRTAKGHEGVGGGSRGIRQRSGRGSAKGLQGVGKDSKGVREGPRPLRQKDFHEGDPRSTKHKKITKATKALEEAREGSAKGPGGPRRATKGLEKARRERIRQRSDPPGGERISTKRQKDIHEGPRRTAKGHEGVGGGSRGIRQRSGRGSAKGLQGVGKDSKGVREGPRRKTLRRKRYPRRTLGLSTKGIQVQEDQEIMFPGSGLGVEHESMPDSHRWTKFFLSILNILFILFIHVQKFLIALSPSRRRQPWRCSRLIQVAGDGSRLCQAWCGRDARAPRKPSSHDLVTPRAPNCRSILVPLVVEGGPSVFWSIRVYSCPLVVRLH